MPRFVRHFVSAPALAAVSGLAVTAWLSGAPCYAQSDAPTDAQSSTSTPAVDPSTPAVPLNIEATDPPKGPKAQGVTVQLGLSARWLTAVADANTSLSTSGIGGTLFVGYRISRVIAGLGFELSHFGRSTEMAAPPGDSTSTRGDTSFVFAPGVQVDIVSSKDRRVELLGAFNIGFGRTVTALSNDPTIPDNYQTPNVTSNFRLTYQIAPGLRYWVHRQFALNFLSGFAGDHSFVTQDNPSGRRADQIAAVGLFGSLSAMGVF